MIRLNIIMALLTFISCGQANNKLPDAKEKNTETTVTPFEFIVYNEDYSMAYAIEYVLTDTNLKIIFKSDIEGDKDTTLFTTPLLATENLKKLSNVNIDSLREHYSNPCLNDGSQITVRLTKNNKSKTVHLSNYYQADIGIAIELINSLTPEKYKIWYNKEELLINQKNCKQ